MDFNTCPFINFDSVNMNELSEHDRAILNCVFNPNLPLDQAANQPQEEHLQDFEEETGEVIESRERELIAINNAEKGQLQDALEMLNNLITKTPYRASLYNNRAQIFQLNGQLLDSFNDLTRAIELAKSTQKKTLCQALCQRGLIHRKSGRIELAKEDFNEAAKLGSQFARNQLVELNPYAALCNQMLKRAFDDLK